MGSWRTSNAISLLAQLKELKGIVVEEGDPPPGKWGSYGHSDYRNPTTAPWVDFGGLSSAFLQSPSLR